MTNTTIKSRLYKALTISIPNLYFFLKIADIKVTEEIPTACITCSSEPILMINPKFVSKHCKSDEHLLMLVLHELYHFILGHTTFNITPDDASNIVFDAVINSLLCKRYKDERYTSFFSSLNSDSDPIGCLLRPEGKNTPKEALPIVNKLYHSNTCSYKEIFDYIMGNPNIKKTYVLIGNHGGNTNLAPDNKKLVDAIIHEMGEDDLMKEAGHSDTLNSLKVKLENPNEKEYKRLTKYFVDSTLENANSMMMKKHDFNYTKLSFVPNSGDRMSFARSLYYDNVIYHAPSHSKRLGLIEGGKTRVYLDVSASVERDIKRMLPLIYKLSVNNLIDTYVFSNKVFKLSKKDIKTGNIKTTGGTDVNCIFDNYYSDRNNKNVKIIIVSDGYFENIENKYIDLIKKNHTKVEVVLFGRYSTSIYANKFTKEIHKFDFKA